MSREIAEAVRRLPKLTDAQVIKVAALLNQASVRPRPRPEEISAEMQAALDARVLRCQEFGIKVPEELIIGAEERRRSWEQQRA